MNRIRVLGLGYVGLPTAVMLVTHGFSVAGVGGRCMAVDPWSAVPLSEGCEER
jgi:UDP-N-acetyl-D-mannosaminuronate dehydrogenase